MRNKIILLVIVFSFNQLIFAETNSKTTDYATTPMNVLVITGTRTEKVLIDSPISISVITEEEIKRSGAEQIGELFRDVPGVEITDTSVAGAKRIRIRGEIGSNVLILVDGQEISEQRSFHGGPPFLANMSSIERIEVIKGPASVLYGSKAIGGVVNIITKRGGDRPVQVGINSSYNGSTNGFDGSAQVYGSANDFDYRVSLSHSNHGDRKVPNGTNDNLAYTNKDGVLENSSFESTSFNSYLAYNMDKITFGGRIESYQSDTESHTDNSIIESGLAEFQLNLPERDREKYSVFFDANDLSKYFLRMKLDAYHQIRNRIFSQDLQLNAPNFAGPGSNIAIDLELMTVFEQKNTGLQGQFDFRFVEDHYTIFGFDYTKDKMNSNVITSTNTLGTVPFPPFTLFDVTDITDTTVQSHQNTKALYLQDEWSLTQDIVITSGVRQTWIDTIMDKENSSVLSLLKVDDSKVVGSVKFLYSGLDDASIRAGWSQGYRVPSLLELLEGTPHGGSGVLHANPALDPETSNSYEIGIRFDNHQFVMDGAIFYTKAKAYIDTVSCTSALTSCPDTFAAADTQFINVNGATTYGLELFSSYAFSDSPFSIYSNLTVLRREFEFVQFKTLKTGHPKFSGRVGIKMETSSNNINYWGDLYARGAVDVDRVSPDGGSPTGRELDPNSGWTTLNLSLGAEFDFKYPLNITLNVNNILDKTYTPSQESLISAGRHFVISFGYKF